MANDDKKPSKGINIYSVKTFSKHGCMVSKWIISSECIFYSCYGVKILLEQPII